MEVLLVNQNKNIILKMKLNSFSNCHLVREYKPSVFEYTKYVENRM
jgi:hypothetical protein